VDHEYDTDLSGIAEPPECRTLVIDSRNNGVPVDEIRAFKSLHMGCNVYSSSLEDSILSVDGF